MEANRIGLPQLEQGRIPISARLYNGFSCIDDIMLPLLGGSITDLSVAEELPVRTAIEPSCSSEIGGAGQYSSLHAIIFIASYAQ